MYSAVEILFAKHLPWSASKPIYKQLGNLEERFHETMSVPFGEKIQMKNNHYPNEHHFYHNIGVLFSHYHLFLDKPQLLDTSQWKACKFHAPTR
ncbi:hypothetical protein MtrunA17_Chr6g0488461 [Medicago truncatula]|uniref:Uncharacterized protein n=1 Tax=Medicago truncatula TaxID=3880 RepID=A0A396HIK0_MEDTR|nr:hypothetical protein MtrunA17_Chr6g0488461 [Medicago truncatula]